MRTIVKLFSALLIFVAFYLLSEAFALDGDVRDAVFWLAGAMTMSGAVCIDAVWDRTGTDGE